jgi:ubiquinone/menaquinone biosynthesis C-methylase UbiE
MYDEAADFAFHREELDRMDAVLAECGVAIDWPGATVCDVGGGGGLRAALLAARARRAHCADILDQQARYGGEFVKLLAEKMQRHGHQLPIDRFEFNITDATRLMFRDDWFDFVCAVSTFEHIPDPVQALAEVARARTRTCRSIRSGPPTRAATSSTASRSPGRTSSSTRRSSSPACARRARRTGRSTTSAGA